tara:strand:- start:55 stop:1014 length:960 start_codon:yes stop_codon:yes gene_type:complete
MENNKTIEGLDKNGNQVKVMLKTPGPQEYRDSQIEYNKAFRKALDSGALLRQKLSDYMTEQGIWDDTKQQKNDYFVDEINAKEKTINSGGIKLSEAKEIALELRGLRYEFREFIAEKNALDQNSVEGQADNARFSELVRLCMLNPTTKKPYFQTQKDYDANGDQPWVAQASSELASMIYGLDPDYDNKLAENKFLKEFNYVNDDLRLVNDSGHLVDLEGSLIDEDGRYVAYRDDKQTEENKYFVNKSGVEVVSITDEDGDVTWVEKGKEVRQPFLDEDGNPILSAKKEDLENEEDLVAKDAKPKAKRTRKTSQSKKASS